MNIDKIDAYLKNLSDDQRNTLSQVRSHIKLLCPESQEVFSYGMPGFKYKNKYLIACGAFKNHMSIFPGSEAIKENKNLLKNYKTSKGTIQFTIKKPITPPILKAIINQRMLEIDTLH